MDSTPRSVDDLKRASFHLQYEIGMLFETAYKIKDEEDIVLYNALLESFIIHARNLIYFFFGDPVWDDIIAEHFIAEWDLHRGLKSLLLRKAEEEANKKVAHLTYRRFVDDYRWDIEAILQELKKLILLFTEMVPDEQVTHNFKSYIASISQGTNNLT